MKTLISILPFLVGISMISTLIAFFFLQSRTEGIARILIVCGAIFATFPPFIIGFVKVQDRELVHALIGTGGWGIGIILLNIGVILFAISLPSKRLQMDAGDKRLVSDQIIKETVDNT